jgi:hypothetical protein
VTTQTLTRHRWVVATCAALLVAAIGDAGPEIVESRSPFAGYDGPGPLIYLAVAAVVAAVRWRFMPWLAVLTGVVFLVGGFADAAFVNRLGTPTEPAAFVGGWLQMAGFAAAVACGVAAVRKERQDSRLEGDRR